MNARTGQPDVIVVGLGPAGATAAYAMAKGGMKVLALEAGPQRSREDYRLDEISESVFQRARLGPKFNQELQTWLRAQADRRDELSLRRTLPRKEQRDAADVVKRSSFEITGPSCPSRPCGYG